MASLITEWSQFCENENKKKEVMESIERMIPDLARKNAVSQDIILRCMYLKSEEYYSKYHIRENKIQNQT